VLSPRGKSALLLYHDRGTAVIVENGEAIREISAGFGPASYAWSDDGETGLAALPSGEIVVFDSSGNHWKAALEGGFPVFLDGKSDALISNARGVWMLRSHSAGGSAALIWEGDALAAVPTGDGRNAVVLDRAQQLFLVNLETRSSRKIECPCLPETVSRLSESVFRVNHLTDGPLWLVDLNESEPRTVFVPAGAKAEE
jgi:hypothetical protein